MAVPTRIFVGITVFGLVCSVLSLATTVFLFTCNAPPPERPLDFETRTCTHFSGGERFFLVLVFVFSLAFTWLGWRSLLAGARRDREMRLRRRGGEASVMGEQKRKGFPVPSPPDEEPPGYQ